MMSPLRDIDETPADWRDAALCANNTEGRPPPDDWFAPEGSFEARDAAEVCFECPVRKECLKWACDSHQQEGTWGGIPKSIRTRPGKGRKAHNFTELTLIPNPYTTDNEKSHLYFGNLLPAEELTNDDE